MAANLMMRIGPATRGSVGERLHWRTGSICRMRRTGAPVSRARSPRGPSARCTGSPAARCRQPTSSRSRTGSGSLSLSSTGNRPLTAAARRRRRRLRRGTSCPSVCRGELPRQGWVRPPWPGPFIDDAFDCCSGRHAQGRGSLVQCRCHDHLLGRTEHQREQARQSPHPCGHRVSRPEQRAVVRLSPGEGVGDGVAERLHRPTQDAAAAPPP